MSDQRDEQGKDNYHGSALPTMELEYLPRHARRPETEDEKRRIATETTGVKDADA